LNVHRFPTSPSLAFGLYKSHYLTENLIPKITGHMYLDIRKGYTGGKTDMFIPYGENVHGYDVNSLYPSQMLAQDMPVGKPIFFEGDVIRRNPNKNHFGFFNVIVTAPEGLDIPVLQTKVNTSSGFRTVAPLGM
jgi:hypothetical protein